MESRGIVTNRKAFRDYSILERQEAGIELVGSEVKSLRQGKANLDESFARIENGEIFLHNLHIAPYAQASYLNVEPMRVRKLLMHRGQISKLEGKVAQRGFTLVPLKLYFNARGIVKVELALGRGRKLYDRRQDIKRREIELELRKAMKRGQR